MNVLFFTKGIPEREMVVAHCWHGKDKPPFTATPKISVNGQGAVITCDTEGASIGYRILEKGEDNVPERHLIRTWDYGPIFMGVKNSDAKEATPEWKVYEGKPYPCKKAIC